jgi:hypothetical protein
MVVLVNGLCFLHTYADSTKIVKLLPKPRSLPVPISDK